MIRITVKGRSVKTSAGIRYRTWHLDRCPACNGKGRQKLTVEQATAWEYDSVICPECEGKGYIKSISYIDSPGRLNENLNFKDVPDQY